MSHLVPEEFIALDIETTGLDPQREDIIELGCVLFRSGAPVENFCSIIHTTRRLSSFIVGLTGITQSEVDVGADLAETLRGLIRFIGNRPLVAHNSGFDLAFLQQKLKSKKMDEIRNPVYDSLLIARLSLPGQTNYKLETLKESLGLGEGRGHRALNDALVCGKLFVTSLNALAEMPESKRAKLSRLVRSHTTDTLKLVERAVPAVEEPEKKRKSETAPQPLLEPEKLKPLGSSDVDAVFGQTGLLKQALPGYEFRSGQFEMAEAVREAFNNEELLVVEAGTGTGKSLAYLVAAAQYAMLNNVRVIISTRTKALQDQIYKKEIPFLRETLGWTFKATLLKGRSNYLCQRKWDETMNASAFLLRGWEADALLPLVTWAETTESGDIADCLAFNEKENRILWARLASDAETCRGSRCASFSSCFIMKRRREALASHLVLINHSLFFTDLKGEGAVLGPCSRVIFDEAHALEEVGRKHLGDEMSHLMLSVTLQKLYKNEEGGKGLLRYLGSLFQREKGEAVNGLNGTLEELCRAVAEAELRSVRFFRGLGQQLKKEKATDKLRYEGPFSGTLVLKENPPDLEGVIARLSAFIGAVSRVFKDHEAVKEALIDISAVLRELEGENIVLVRLLEGRESSSVFWAETASNPLNSKLIGVPLEIRKILSGSFLERASSAVFTSATLAVKKDLTYFCTRIGLTLTQSGRTVQRIIPSPYRFNEQLLCSAISSIRSPDDPGYVGEIADLVGRVSRALGKRMLLLFTSRDMLRSVFEAASPLFAELGRPLLAQDINGSGWQLLEEMRKNPGAVLLGTDSFWEGIDLPGDHLEILFIARLPFGVPTDPVVEARSRACEEQGENAFHVFYMPEAIIKFRQGIGRLIRRQDDRGAVILLDRRIMDKPYGKVFINSISADKIIYPDFDQAVQGLVDFFGTKR